MLMEGSNPRGRRFQGFPQRRGDRRRRPRQALRGQLELTRGGRLPAVEPPGQFAQRFIASGPHGAEDLPNRLLDLFVAFLFPRGQGIEGRPEVRVAGPQDS